MLMEMVLRNPRAIEAETFGVADLFGRQAVALLWRRVVQQTGEKAQTFTRRCGAPWPDRG